jgi:hypothetical protein
VDIATKQHLSRRYRERIVDVRLAEVKTVIDRGIERGDLRRDTNVRLAHDDHRTAVLLAPLQGRAARQQARERDRRRGDACVFSGLSRRTGSRVIDAFS